MTRKRQLWILIVLSASTAVAQYATQGVLAMGELPGTLPGWFKTAEAGLWALRAFVESIVVVYLFQTTTDDAKRGCVLAVLEVSLIALIALTLGPALRALGYGQTMLATWGEPWFTAWNFGIAAYAPLMIGSAGYAYKCQPHDDEALAITADQLHQLHEAQRERDEAHALAEAARQAVAGVRAFQALSATAQARVIAASLNGDRPTPSELAPLLGDDGVSPSTVSRGYKQAEE